MPLFISNIESNNKGTAMYRNQNEVKWTRVAIEATQMLKPL